MLRVWVPVENMPKEGFPIDDESYGLASWILPEDDLTAIADGHPLVKIRRVKLNGSTGGLEAIGDCHVVRASSEQFMSVDDYGIPDMHRFAGHAYGMLRNEIPEPVFYMRLQ